MKESIIHQIQQKNIYVKVNRKPIYMNSDIYQLKCEDCHLKYVVQTGHKFEARYKKHSSNMYIKTKFRKYTTHNIQITLIWNVTNIH